MKTLREEVFARQHPEDPELEYASRELARRTLIDFTTYTFPQYIPEKFHLHLSEHLEYVINGDIPRLMIFSPPQHGKSEMVSVRLPSFWMSKQPDLPVLVCSYGASLANEKTALARDIIHSEEYFNLFPDLFKNAPKWSRRKRILKNYNSKIYSAGVRGPITGKGIGLGIIDDPIKDWQTAYSLYMRDSVWQWWKGVFRTRIWEKGRIVLIMTRWHEDDLAGRILNSSGEKWVVLRYPAIAETQKDRDEYSRKYLKTDIGKPDLLNRSPGEPLAPKRYSLGGLLDIKHDVGTRAWSAEYQGTPKPIEGNRIHQEWLKYYETLSPEQIQTIRWARYWDKAATQDGGAHSSGVLMGIDKNSILYIEDLVQGQWTPVLRNEKIKEQAIIDNEKYGRVEIWVETEPGSGGIESSQRSIAELQGFIVRADRPTKSKEVRFESFAVQTEAGNVFIRNNAKWTWEYVDELLLFPNGVFKDACDATSGCFKILAQSGWSRTTT